MARESVFNTPREKTLTSDQMLENLINRKNNRFQNVKALESARKNIEDIPDFTATMESTTLEAEENAKREIALENAYYKQGSKRIAKNKLALRAKLLQEGTVNVYNKVLGEIIYDSYWIDDDVKQTAVSEIAESVGRMFNYLDTNCLESKVPTSKQSRLMRNIHDVVESIVKEATDRIMKETEEENNPFADFELTDKEESELNNDLGDLGRDEIVSIIKDKVAQVIQDEKERGQQRSETFKEINEKLNDNEDTIEDTDDNSDEPSTDDGDVTSVSTEESVIAPVGEYTLESALSLDPTDTRYTSNERYISGILEGGACFDCFSDPSWVEFKSCLSLLCKKAKNILSMSNCECCSVVPILDEISNKLSNVPENVPADIKEFIMSAVAIIYTAVPQDECIISRMSNPLGLSDIASGSNIINYTTIGWNDLLVNIKINLASIKSYCLTKSCKSDKAAIPKNLTVEEVKSPKVTLESLTAKKTNRMLNKSIGNTLFESFMMSNLATTEKTTMESVSVTSEDIEDMALVESLLDYTILESLSTLGVYNFKSRDIDTIKRDFVKSVTEGVSPLETYKSDKVIIKR